MLSARRFPSQQTFQTGKKQAKAETIEQNALSCGQSLSDHLQQEPGPIFSFS